MRGLEQRLRLDASSRTGWLREGPDRFVCRSDVIYVRFRRGSNESFLDQAIGFLMIDAFGWLTRLD
jgi:hypothetical protein